MAYVMDSGSSSLGVTRSLSCILRQDHVILAVPLATQIYQWWYSCIGQVCLSSILFASYLKGSRNYNRANIFCLCAIDKIGKNLSGVQCNTDESPSKLSVRAKWLTQGCYMNNSGRPQLNITPDN